MGTVTAIVSDTHIGGTTALSLPEWECDTGLVNQGGEAITQTYKATKAQEWIYACWLDFWKYAFELAKGHRLVVIHAGDIVDGNHHRTVQALPNLYDQEAMAIQLLKPVVDWCDKFTIVRGTEAHAGEGAQSEARIARELGVSCSWESIFDIDGLIVDVAHHGRTGRRAWTSAAAGMAAEAIHDAVTDIPPRPVPRYVFRGHNHLIDDSGAKVSGTRAIALPSWQLKTAFGHRVAAGKRSDIGGAIILPNGELDLSKLRYFAAPGQGKVVKL